MSKGGPSAFAGAESCRWFCLGPLIFWEVLLIFKGGPINLLGGAADVQEWANCIFQLPLLMASLWPINVLREASDAYGWAYHTCSDLLPMASLWPIVFSAAAANNFALAH